MLNFLPIPLHFENRSTITILEFRSLEQLQYRSISQKIRIKNLTNQIQSAISYQPMLCFPPCVVKPNSVVIYLPTIKLETSGIIQITDQRQNYDAAKVVLSSAFTCYY